MFLMLNLYDKGGVTYDSEEMKVIHKITQCSILSSYEVLPSVERIVAGQVIDSAFYFCRNDIGDISFGKNSNLNKIDSNVLAYTKIKSCDMSNCVKLTFLGANSFDNCRSLTKLILPPNLIEISHHSVQATSLSTITIPDSVEIIDSYSFNGNGNLKEVIISENSNLEKIGAHSFMGSGIKSFYLPKNLTLIEAAPFLNCRITKYACNPLNSVFKVDEQGMTIYSNDFKEIVSVANGISGEYKSKDTVETIKKQAFRGAQFTSIILNQGITYIDEYSFSRTKITEITIPEGVTNLTAYIFEMADIVTVHLPQSLTELCAYSFSNAIKLKNIILPDNLEKISDYSFKGCSALERIDIPMSVTSFGVSVFSMCNDALVVNFLNTDLFRIENQMLFVNGSKLSEYFGKDNSDITIPSFCTLVPNSLFAKKKINNVGFQEGGTNIEFGSEAFSMSSIKSIELPSWLSKIGKSCFYQCNELRTISFSNTAVQEIPEMCFFRCQNLATVVLQNSQIRTIDVMAFYASPLENFDFTIPLETIRNKAFFQTKLTNIVFPYTITTIDFNAFSECTKLITVSFEDCQHIKELSKFVFENCADLTSIKLGPNIGILRENCLRCCSSLASLTLAPNTSILEINCLYQCTSLKKIVIPEGSMLERILPFALEGCSKLTSIEVLAKDKFFFENGILMNAQRTKIIFYLPTTKKSSVIISGNVEEITQYAFQSAYNLREVIVSDGNLSRIGTQAFKDCINLKRLILPMSLESIDINAFDGCNKLICGCVIVPQKIQQQAIDNGKLSVSLFNDVCKNTECNVMKDSITCNVKSGAFMINTLPLLMLSFIYTI